MKITQIYLTRLLLCLSIGILSGCGIYDGYTLTPIPCLSYALRGQVRIVGTDKDAETGYLKITVTELSNSDPLYSCDGWPPATPIRNLTFTTDTKGYFEIPDDVSSGVFIRTDQKIQIQVQGCSVIGLGIVEGLAFNTSTPLVIASC
jgi:hypothetical protein